MSLFARIEPKLQLIVQRYEEIESRMGDPAVAGNSDQLKELLKERAHIEGVVRRYREWRELRGELEDTEAELAAASDAEMRAYCTELVAEIQTKRTALEDDLLADFIRDEDDASDQVILEIRAGVGGDEATIWVADLLRMYEGWCRNRGLKLLPMHDHPVAGGGFKEVILEVVGAGAFTSLKYESGGHRVQRVPVTESQGRVHTSAATVAVLPEATESDVVVDERELKIDTYRSSGPGGQHANKTSSAIRITHLPTGLVVTCQDEKSQHRNKARALRVLRARLADQERARAAAERSQQRSGLVGTGDRSDRIRTYNYPQSRVTDHRIDRTAHNLTEILGGGMTELFDALFAFDREHRLAQLAESL